MVDLINDSILRESLSILKKDGQLFEIRLMSMSGAKARNLSGYFRDVETAIDALYNVPDLEDYNCYFVLNSIKSACYSRVQSNKFVANPKSATSDSDIEGYDYLFIDLDPVRPAGTSSSDEELEKAKAVGNQIFTVLRANGFSNPITAMSGNGVHLLYPVYLDNTEANKKLIHDCLSALDMLFGTDDVHVDTSNGNPSRLCKLYGTASHKGADTPDRPHRMATIISYDDEMIATDRVYLQRLADMLPKQEKPQKYNNYNPREFDLEEWMNRYGIQYRKSTYQGGVKYVLSECPFDSNHKAPDAAVFQSTGGALGFHCFHNSCQDKTWKDLRMLFEPTAYEKKQEQYRKMIYKHYNSDKDEQDDSLGEPELLTALQIFQKQRPPETFVPSGIAVIDQKMRGLKKGNVSVMSGLNGCGKSSIISGIALDAIQAGYHVAVYSGELSDDNFMKWMNLQAAGRGFTEPTNYAGYYIVKDDYRKQIAEWLDGKFWLYNNAYGNNFQRIMGVLEEHIAVSGLDLIMLDNLMTFNIHDLSTDKYEAQSAFVKQLKKMAMQYQVHIMFVAHPRKSYGFLRKDDISGTADLSNAVDTVLIVHRNNNDFQRLSKEMMHWRDDNPVYHSTNCIEIAKDRDGGLVDEFIPLWYEAETKRLKSSESECKMYGWHDDFSPIQGDDDLIFD